MQKENKEHTAMFTGWAKITLASTTKQNQSFFQSFGPAEYFYDRTSSLTFVRLSRNKVCASMVSIHSQLNHIFIRLAFIDG